MIKLAKKRLPRANSPFRELKLKAKLTQEQLADEIGVMASSIMHWKKGDTKPAIMVAQIKGFC